MSEINKSSLIRALSVMFNSDVTDADFATEILQGGTVGNVSKISGTAKTKNGIHPFTLVLKTQKQWDRHGDPNCWHREYDIYESGLYRQLPEYVKLPRCLLLERDEGLTQIWMEFVEGATGNKMLNANELAYCAEMLGRFQADFHKNGQRGLSFLRSFPAVKSSYDLWHGRMRCHLSKPIDGFPDEIRQKLNHYASRSGELLSRIYTLPDTLCQGDVHHDNLILCENVSGTDVYLIDWDSAGYGRMGEDAVDVLMEAFVYSDRDVSELPRYRRDIINAYQAGAQSIGVDFVMGYELVRDIFALAWGFRIADLYLYYKDVDAKQRCVEILKAML